MIEPHDVDVVAQHGRSLLVRQLMCRRPIFQRLRDAGHGLNDCLIFGDPLFNHALSPQRPSRRHHGDQGQDRQPDWQRQPGVQLETTEEVHGLPRPK